MVKQILFSIAFLFVTLLTQAQELNCSVTITTNNINQTDSSTFKALEQKVLEFMNETVWTKEKFEPEERISCSINLDIVEEINVNHFKAVATIKSSRPVYNSTYETVMLNIVDKDFEFEFDPYTILDYKENSFANNLTSILAFYAYTIIAYDYDTFSVLGGQTYHAKAQTIVQNASNSTYRNGWTQTDTNNSGDISRFWISNNFTEPRYNSLMTQIYQYHRKGLDQLYDEPKRAWNAIDRMMQAFKHFNNENRNSALVYMFMNSKGQEIVDIMSKAPKIQRLRVAKYCMEIDPVNTKKYRTLTK